MNNFFWTVIHTSKATTWSVLWKKGYLKIPYNAWFPLICSSLISSWTFQSIQGHISNPVENLWWIIFAKIVIGFYSITIFAKIPIIDIHQSSKCVSAFSLRLFKHLILLKYYTSFKWKILKCKPAFPRVQVCQPTSCESASLRVARLRACELQSVSLWAANMWVTSRMHYELWAATRPVCELQAISHVSQ